MSVSDSRLLDPHTSNRMLERLHRRRRGEPESAARQPGNGEPPEEGADAAAREMAAEHAAAEHAASAQTATATGGESPEPRPSAHPGPRCHPSWCRAGSSSCCCRSRLLGLWALARAAGTVLLILIAASTVALILNPLVKMIERRRVPRGLSILVVYLSGFAILGGVGVLLSNTVSTQVSHLQTDVPAAGQPGQ